MRLLILLLLLPVGQAFSQGCLPRIFLRNGLSVNIGPVDTDKDMVTDDIAVTLSVSDFLLYAQECPGGGPLQFSINKGFGGSGPTQDTVISFDCSDIGTNEVEIWAVDAQNNISYATTYVIVQDNAGWCNDAPPALPVDCENDLIPPTLKVMNGLSAALAPDGEGSASTVLRSGWYVIDRKDNCGDQPVSRYRIASGFSPPLFPKQSQIVMTCDDPGTQFVRIWAEDLAGNTAYAETYTIIQDYLGFCPNNIPPGNNPDLIPPSVVVLNGIVTALDQNVSTEIWASDFIVYTGDPSGVVSDFRISKSSSGLPGPPSTTSVSFDCSELGTQFVELWVADNAGNWNVSETYIIIQDNNGLCGSSPK